MKRCCKIVMGLLIVASFVGCGSKKEPEETINVEVMEEDLLKNTIVKSENIINEEETDINEQSGRRPENGR